MSFLLDRNTLQEHLAGDLHSFLDSRKCIGLREKRAVKFAVKAQLADLNRKANDVGVTPEQSDVALNAFLEIQRGFAASSPFPGRNVIEALRHDIYQLLPPIHNVWGDIWECCGFGPGTVFHAKTPHERSLLHKIGGRQTVSPKARQLAVSVIGEYFPNFAERIRECQVVRGNRLAHVPKDVRKSRLIAVEPSLNVFLQKGVGEYLSRLLKRAGWCDLRDGQAFHREAVRSRFWGTIDLSNASDTISTSLVRAVLPPDWFELLDTLRSHWYYTNGEWSQYSTFSSQGNAFTFALESLLFKAVCRLTSDRSSVYGDDILVPKERAAATAVVLESLGFQVNTEKSFWGQHSDERRHFRESCGEDSLYGISVRSVFYKDPARFPRDVAVLANRLYERWGFLPQTHRYLAESIPPRDRLIGPARVISDGESIEYSSYLWDEWFDLLDLPGVLPKRRVCPLYQAVTFRLKYWSDKARELPNNRRLQERDQILAFLYSGSPFSSPLSTPKVRSKTVSLGGAWSVNRSSVFGGYMETAFK